METSKPLDSRNLQSGAEVSLDDFKKEIEALKTAEAINGGHTVNLFEVTVADLTSADMTMWRLLPRSKPNGRDALIAVFEDYRAQTVARGNPSSKAFAAFLANELMKASSRAQ